MKRLILIAIIGFVIAVAFSYYPSVVSYFNRPSTTATAMAERAKMFKMAVPDVQKQYQSIMLEVTDSYVTIRTYCYQGTLIFTNAHGEPFGVAAGACKWKSH